MPLLDNFTARCLLVASTPCYEVYLNSPTFSSPHVQVFTSLVVITSQIPADMHIYMHITEDMHACVVHTHPTPLMLKANRSDHTTVSLEPVALQVEKRSQVELQSLPTFQEYPVTKLMHLAIIGLERISRPTLPNS
jgi:hypothetical protein